MDMDELTEHQKHLREIYRAAQDECHMRRMSEIAAAQDFMRALGKGGDAREAEAEWRFAQARFSVGEWGLETAHSDLLAVTNLILDQLEGRAT